jgi:hypothetical protein
MTEAGMSAEPAQSSRSTPISTGGVRAIILRRFAEISAAAANFFRPSRPGSAEEQAESGAVEAEATTTNAAVTANVNGDSGPEIKAVAHFAPDQQEIERRRNLVRVFFNDFWRGASDKPTAFVERLDQAEDYLNERLAANRELWRVDATTRLMLGLPPRANSSESAKPTSWRYAPHAPRHRA